MMIVRVIVRMVRLSIRYGDIEDCLEDLLNDFHLFQGARASGAEGRHWQKGK